jgi:uncharacterized Tic20 family protein
MDKSFGSVAAPNEITKDEKMLGLFCHLSLFLGGIVLPIVFWATNKDKSKFVTFHALQSIWFHVVYIVSIVVLVMIMVIGGIGMGAIFGAAGKGASKTMPPVFVFLMVAVYGVIFVIIMIAIIYAVYMGIKAYNGELKKYPVIGNMMYKKVYGEQK